MRHLGTINLKLPGVGNVQVIAGPDAVEQLRRASNEAQRVSTGRKPGRV